MCSSSHGLDPLRVGFVPLSVLSEGLHAPPPRFAMKIVSSRGKSGARVLMDSLDHGG